MPEYGVLKKLKQHKPGNLPQVHKPKAIMISIIIPTYNEAGVIGRTIAWLREHGNQNLITEIIVTDGGSRDGTIAAAEHAGAVAVVSPAKGRAAQMNYGAAQASGSVLYFLHADTLPPPHFTRDIMQAVAAGYHAGCFMLSFDHAHWFLQANCWFTRFDVAAFRYGDQSLFVQKEAFEQSGGFCTAHIVMEDHEYIKRLRKGFQFAIIKKPVLTSARKYLTNGIYKTQGVFYLIYFMYRFGFSQQQLVRTYRNLIRQDKL
jgi:rSAM/selenodomain-associated transferase 2